MRSTGRATAGNTARRRWVLRAVAVGLLAGGAGCTSGEIDGPDSPTPGPPARDRRSPTPTAREAGMDTTGDDVGDTRDETTKLDLREANATGVDVERRDSSSRFSVTLYHDDDGEDGYADWWQVESAGGERLGRRELLHGHGTRPFTRSASVDVPNGVACVVVRGHDQTHGYGGRAILVDVESGATVPLDQGPDRQSVDQSRCP